MRLSRSAPELSWRFWAAIGVLSLFVLGILARIVYLNIIDRPFLEQQGNERALRNITIPSYRGIITDRNGIPLAISTPVYAIWADPKTLSATTTQETQLATLIRVPKEKMLSFLKANANMQFIYLQRDVDPGTAKQIAALKIKGVHLEQQYRRYYPDGPVLAQILGMTNIDDQGQAGLELSYNQWLQGTPGKKQVLIDRFGHVIENVAVLKKPVPGHNLVLSIDNRIQYIAYHELLKGVKKYDASSGAIVVLDVRTGEILAMASVPSYNPNLRPKDENGSYRNRAMTDTFEPGSTMKPFAMTAAFLTGKYNPDSIINTNPGYYYIDGFRISDDGVNNGIINMTRVLQVSSNVGMSKVILTLPPETLPDFLRKVGFGQTTHSGFPGESTGYVPNYTVWPKADIATLAFGYGVSVTLVQLAHAYSIFANNGVEVPVSFLRLNKPPKGKQMIPPKIAHELLKMLEAVLRQGGTGVTARVPGYHIAGKTGTSRILGPHGYELNHHNGDFVGIAPVDHPRLIVAIEMHNPEKQDYYYGGQVAAPIFSRVMESALRLMDVPPDNPKTLTPNPFPDTTTQP